MGVECASCGQVIPPGQFRCSHCGAVQQRDSFDDYGGLTEVAQAEPPSTPRSATPEEPAPLPAPRTSTTSDRAPAPAGDDEETAREPAVPRGTFASELPDRSASEAAREGQREPSKPALKPVAPPTSPAKNGAARTKTPVRSAPRPPYLASEILREDLAPSEPGRFLLGLVLQVGSALGGVALLASGIRHSATWVGLTVLGSLFLLTRFELTYATLALLVTLTGGGALALVSAWRIALGGSFEDPLLAAASTLLPAALLFRAWYRTSHASRFLVGVALVLALTWAAATSHRELLALEFSWDSWLPALTWYLFGLLCLLSMLAFMGGETTGGCDAWAIGLLVWYGLHACVRFALESVASTAEVGNSRTLGLVEPALAAPTAIALAQLFARWFGARSGRR